MLLHPISRHNLLFLVTLLSLFCRPVLSACDSSTCQHCCINDICEDNIIECKISNNKSYKSILYLSGIIAFWWLLIPYGIVGLKKLILFELLFSSIATFCRSISTIFCCCGLFRKSKKRRGAVYRKPNKHIFGKKKQSAKIQDDPEILKKVSTSNALKKFRKVNLKMVEVKKI